MKRRYLSAQAHWLGGRLLRPISALLLLVGPSGCGGTTPLPPDGGLDAGPDAGPDGGAVREAPPSYSADYYLAVAGTAVDDLWIGGLGIARHWDGKHWSRLAQAIDAGGQFYTAQINAVQATAGRAMWACISWPFPDTERWDGTAWTFSPISGTAGSELLGSTCSGIWAADPDADVWAVGSHFDSSQLWHWSGQKWAEWSEPALEGGPLVGISGTGASDVWAVSQPSGATSHLPSAFVHWDGVHWTVFGTITGALAAVHARTVDDAWAVGDRIHRWDGHAWIEQSAVPARPLAAVWAASSTDVWAVGSAGTALHFDGLVWSAVDLATTADLTAVWGLGPTDVWVVGAGGTIRHLP